MVAAELPTHIILCIVFHWRKVKEKMVNACAMTDNQTSDNDPSFNTPGSSRGTGNSNHLSNHLFTWEQVQAILTLVPKPIATSKALLELVICEFKDSEILTIRIRSKCWDQMIKLELTFME